MQDQQANWSGSTDDAPLAGIRVVEVSMYVQGPVAGLSLASLGADVIKIEQVGREDVMRSMAGTFGVRYDDKGIAWQYASLNRGKRSLAIDIAGEEGGAVFRKLIETADVFVTNLRDAGLKRVGADYESLRAINPRLVYARGGGFGLRGPLANDPCQDTVGMAYAGFMDVTSTTDTPNYPPGSMSDVLTGTNLASAVLAGLVRRSITGEGQLVGTSQVQSLLWLQNQSVGLAATTGQRMVRFNAEKPSNPLFSVYPTADGWIAIAAIHPHQWPPIAEILGLNGLLTDERFATFDALMKHRPEITQILKDTFALKPTREWWQALRQADVWTSPVHRLTELADDEQIVANEYLVTFPDGTVGPPAPFEVGDWHGARSVAAGYGEHTDEILTSLGLTDDELVELRISGAIW